MSLDVIKVCEILDIKTTKEETLNRVGLLVSASIAMSEKFCGRKFFKETHTELFIGNNNSYVITQNYPILNVISSPLPVFFIRNNEINFSKDLFKGSKNLITYESGYEELPKDLELAIIEIVGWKYKLLEHLDVKSNRAEDGSTVSYLVDDLPANVKMILNNYKKKY